MFLYLACPASISFFSSYLRGRPPLSIIIWFNKVVVVVVVVVVWSSVLSFNNHHIHKKKQQKHLHRRRSYNSANFSELWVSINPLPNNPALFSTS